MSINLSVYTNKYDKSAKRKEKGKRTQIVINENVNIGKKIYTILVHKRSVSFYFLSFFSSGTKEMWT